MIKLNQETFSSHIEKGVSIVDFSAESWCGPCKMLAPVFEKLSSEMKNMKFAKIDVDDNTQVASMFSVMSVPTIIIFKNGEEIGRINGFHPYDILKDKINELIK